MNINKMEQIHNLRIHNFININSIKYEIIDIQVIKTGKCFRDHYGNNYVFELKNEKNEIIYFKFNGQNINEYIIKLV